MSGGPHQGQSVRRAGARPGEAAAAVVLAHGRGGDPEDMLALAGHLRVPGVAYLAPEAAGHTWYPNSFLAPLASNEPWLSSALELLAATLARLGEEGVPPERTMMLGFSQGACLILEHAARRPRRYGAVVAFTGGLIGPPGTPRGYPGSLHGTPAFLGSGDPDPHVPWARVEETATVLRRMGAEVTARRYAGMPHTVNEDELQAARALLAALVTPASAGSP
jgi:predicted esterase